MAQPRGSARSARAAAPSPSRRSDAVLKEQWRSLDSLLDTMAQKTRTYVATAEEDDVADVAQIAAPSQAMLVLRQERDRLRGLLATANNDLRAARAEIHELRSRLGQADAAPAPARAALSGWWSRWLQRLR